MKNENELKINSIPDCPVCGKPYAKEVIDLTSIGKGLKETYRPDCECTKNNSMKEFKKKKGRELIDRIKEIKNCGIGKRFSGKTFSNYKKDRNLKAYKACYEYAKNIEKYIGSGEGLFLSGGVGTGKTHLISGIIDYIARMKKRDWHYKIIYITSVDLLSEIRMGFKNNEAQELVGNFEEADLLIIDDIGIEKITDWVNEIFYKIIDHRYNEMKPTIFISNLSDDELLAKLGERIVSRIYEMCRGLKLYGKDYRTL